MAQFLSKKKPVFINIVQGKLNLQRPHFPERMNQLLEMENTTTRECNDNTKCYISVRFRSIYSKTQAKLEHCTCI